MNISEELKKRLSEKIGPSEKNDRVVIIDGLNSFIRVFAAVPALNDNGEPIGGVVGFLKSIGSNIRQFNATRCVVVFDGKGGSQRRKKVYPEYKASRNSTNRLNRFHEFKDAIDEKESMKLQFTKLVEYLKLLPITLISIDNIEADDVIAYIAMQYFKNVDNKITIVSTDRDFLQLVSDQVNVYSPTKKKLYNQNTIKDEYGFDVQNFTLYKAINGDMGDNIPGIQGIGLKTLLSRFTKFAHEKYDIDSFLLESKMELENGSKLKIYNNIVDNEYILRRNYDLMQLMETDISGNSKLTINSLMDAPISKLNKTEFRKIFLEDKLYDSIKNLDSWLNDTYNKLNKFTE